MPGIRKGAESHIFMLANKVKQEKEKTTLLTITLSIELQTYVLIIISVFWRTKDISDWTGLIVKLLFVWSFL